MIKLLRARLIGGLRLNAKSLLVIAFAVMAGPVSSVACTVVDAIRTHLWPTEARVWGPRGWAPKSTPPPLMVMAYFFGGEVGAARLVLSVIADGRIGFAWPLTSHFPLSTEQRPEVAAARAVQDARNDRWPLA